MAKKQRTYAKRDLMGSRFMVGSQNPPVITCVQETVDEETGEVTRKEYWKTGLMPGVHFANELKEMMPADGRLILEGDIQLVGNPASQEPKAMQPQQHPKLRESGANQFFKPRKTTDPTLLAEAATRALKRENDRAERLREKRQAEKRAEREAKRKADEEAKREADEAAAEAAEEAKRQAAKEAADKAAAEASGE